MEHILEKIGAFGRYQKIMLFLIGIISAQSAALIFSNVFTTATPRLVCTPVSNDTIELSTCQMWSELKRNSSAPYECAFDKTYYESTLVTELGLVCERQWMASLIVTINLAAAVSGLFTGFFSDHYGRKRSSLVLSILMSIVMSIWLLFFYDVIHVEGSTLYVLFCVLQFICGAMGKSVYLISYILIFELTTAKYTTIVTNVFTYMYVAGQLFVLVVVYVISEWRVLMACLTGFTLLVTLMVMFFIPESPGFLVSKKRDEQLNGLIKRIATVNGKIADVNKDELEMETRHDEEEKHNTENQKPITLMLKRENLIKICLFIVIWFSLALCYFGVSLGITNIDEHFNPFLMYLLSCLAEAIGVNLLHLNDRFGQRRMMMVFLISSSVILLAVAFLPGTDSEGNLTLTAVLKIIFATVGKMIVSAALMSNYVFCSREFPASIRSSVFVFTFNVGQVGALISPQINLLQSLVWTPLPYFIFGSSALVSTLCVFFLPDPDKKQFL